MICPKCNTGNPDGNAKCSHCGTALSVKDEFDSSSGMRTSFVVESTGGSLKKGSLFAGRYEILEDGVKGGMGIVYKVKDKTLGKVKALKIVLPEYLGNEKTISRFKQEVAISQELLHENIVRVYDIGQSEGSIYFTMEWIEGISLRDCINERKKQNRKFAFDEILNFGKQLCTALSYAHKSVIHRDIKPENILLIDPQSQYPKIKITDFGIAKTESQTLHVSVSAYMGTPIYMAPEQYTDASHVDKRADIYSIGVVLYELMTFLHPLGTFPMPCEANPSLPKQADIVIRRALSSDKTKRYEDAMDIMKELETPPVEEEPTVKQEIKVEKPSVGLPVSEVKSETVQTPQPTVLTERIIERQEARVEKPIIIQTPPPKAPERPPEVKTFKKSPMIMFAAAITIILIAGGIFFYKAKTEQPQVVNKPEVSQPQPAAPNTGIIGQKKIDDDLKKAEEERRKAEIERRKAEELKTAVDRERADAAKAAKDAASRDAMAREAALREADRQAVSQYMQDGKRYFDMGKYELSIEKMKEVLKRDRNNYEANRYVQMAQERLDQIEREFRNPNVGRSR